MLLLPETLLSRWEERYEKEDTEKKNLYHSIVEFCIMIKYSFKG
jgi:hypothetical protein